jgi:hypothetical protein
MNYENAKDTFDELKNFEGRATFKGKETVIEYFVLLPRTELEDFSLERFLDHYTASGSFEIEGDHDAKYTIIGINAAKRIYSDDADYFARLLVW